MRQLAPLPNFNKYQPTKLSTHLSTWYRAYYGYVSWGVGVWGKPTGGHPHSSQNRISKSRYRNF